ncbi:MAG: ribonuclease E/G, partial [Microbacteriaceae bacterium]|nr:ribonuclease E/G [Microbacteriaceae bacterium]
LVQRRLIECLGRDRTKHQVAEVTSLGLVQMTRKKLGVGLLESFSESCGACEGSGAVWHADGAATKKDVAVKRRGRNGGVQTHVITDKAKNMLVQVAASTIEGVRGDNAAPTAKVVTRSTVKNAARTEKPADAQGEKAAKTVKTGAKPAKKVAETLPETGITGIVQFGAAKSAAQAGDESVETAVSAEKTDELVNVTAAAAEKPAKAPVRGRATGSRRVTKNVNLSAEKPATVVDPAESDQKNAPVAAEPIIVETGQEDAPTVAESVMGDAAEKEAPVAADPVVAETVQNTARTAPKKKTERSAANPDAGRGAAPTHRSTGQKETFGGRSEKSGQIGATMMPSAKRAAARAAATPKKDLSLLDAIFDKKEESAAAKKSERKIAPNDPFAAILDALPPAPAYGQGRKSRRVTRPQQGGEWH